MIDAFASWPHLVAHLAPIWTALDPNEQGAFAVVDKTSRDYATRYGIDAELQTPREGDRPTLIASHHDLTQIARERPPVYVEHGAGQTYTDRAHHPSYSGGTQRDRVRLFLTLNEATAVRERGAYPTRQVAVVGSPRVEWLRDRVRVRPESSGLDAEWQRMETAHPVVAYAPHWDCSLVPETRWAYPEWRNHLAALAKTTTVLGHGHPRVFAHLVPWYEKYGIEPVRDFEDVVERADVLVTDNSSAGPEWAAATGRPVVWLNSSRYRKDVTHGGRFWDWPSGQVMLDPGDPLEDGVVAAFADLPEAQAGRARMVAQVYPVLDGGAAKRAVEAIRAAGLT